MSSRYPAAVSLAPRDSGYDARIESPARHRSAPALTLFAVTAVLVPALAFAVQPLLVKMILPQLGGSPSTWVVAMLFFQATLLAAYQYAHQLGTRVARIGRQAAVHVLVATAALATLPFSLRGTELAGSLAPALGTTLLLAASGGLAYFALAATTPLLQAWVARTTLPSARDPYWLFAASNVGSLLGLLSYPFVVEPAIGLRLQSQLWAGGFVAAGLAMVACAVTARRLARQGPVQAAPTDDPAGLVSLTAGTSLAIVARAAVAVVLLMSATIYITADIVPAPLFWVLPLACYLLSFIAAFSRIPPRILAVVSLAGAALVLTAIATVTGELSDRLGALVGMHLALLTFATTALHARIAADRPPARELTRYYLLISLGGLAGGVIAAVIAPLVFDNLLEYLLGVLAALALARSWNERRLPRLAHLTVTATMAALVAIGLLQLWIEEGGAIAPYSGSEDLDIAIRVALVAIAVALPRATVIGVVAFAVAFPLPVVPNQLRAVESSRSFLGTLNVLDVQGTRIMVHGSTLHGAQLLDDPTTPTSYYHRGSPAASAFELMRTRPAAGGLRFGIVGLGAGTLAAYGADGDTMTMFELDPAVVRAADEHFSFLERSEADITVREGDARITLEDEPDDSFDVLVLDAYSGDSVPVHLLTREALRLYVDKAAPTGVILFHISSRYAELDPVIAAIAQEHDLVALVRHDFPTLEEEAEGYADSSTWVAVAGGELVQPEGLERLGWEPVDPRGQHAWTDDRSSVLSVIDWN